MNTTQTIDTAMTCASLQLNQLTAKAMPQLLLLHPRKSLLRHYCQLFPLVNSCCCCCCPTHPLSTLLPQLPALLPTTSAHHAVAPICKAAAIAAFQPRKLCTLLLLLPPLCCLPHKLNTLPSPLPLLLLLMPCPTCA